MTDDPTDWERRYAFLLAPDGPVTPVDPAFLELLYADRITELQSLETDMEMGCLRALPQALAYCVENNVPVPVEFARALMQLPGLRLEERYSREERWSIRAASLEASEEYLDVDLLENIGDINKQQVAECAARVLAKLLPNQAATARALSHWWFGACGGKPYRAEYKNTLRSDFQWYRLFARELKLFE